MEKTFQEETFEKKLRTLRQEADRIKAHYEVKAGQTSEGRRVKELEDENERIKKYYNSRIREVKDKQVYGKAKDKRPPSA